MGHWVDFRDSSHYTPFANTNPIMPSSTTTDDNNRARPIDSFNSNQPASAPSTTDDSRSVKTYPALTPGIRTATKTNEYADVNATPATT